MKLISQVLYEMVYRPEKLLQVDAAIEDTWQRAHVYIHLAAKRKGDDFELIDKSYELQPGQTIQVLTLEQFTLSLSVMGTIGSCTDMIRSDLELIYAPFIDPGYSGRVLTMAIRNNGQSPTKIVPKQRIGKIVFFDVSESHLLLKEAVEIREEKVKRELSDRVLDALTENDNGSVS